MSSSRTFPSPELLPSFGMSRQILGYLGSNSRFSGAGAKKPFFNKRLQNAGHAGSGTRPEIAAERQGSPA
jgi:hypothetical protein